MLDLHQASDVAGRYRLRAGRADRLRLARAEVARGVGVLHVVETGRPAAHLAVGNLHHLQVRAPPPAAHAVRCGCPARARGDRRRGTPPSAARRRAGGATRPRSCRNSATSRTRAEKRWPVAFPARRRGTRRRIPSSPSRNPPRSSRSRPHRRETHGAALPHACAPGARRRSEAQGRRSTPAAAGTTTSTPLAASTRSVAWLMSGSSTCCTQPASSATRARRGPRAGAMAGRRAAGGRRSGSSASIVRIEGGSSLAAGLAIRPTSRRDPEQRRRLQRAEQESAPQALEDRPPRLLGAGAERDEQLAVLTPDGHAVTQPRQPRQRSMCGSASSSGRSPSSTPFMSTMRPRGESISSPSTRYVGQAGRQNPQCTQVSTARAIASRWGSAGSSGMWCCTGNQRKLMHDAQCTMNARCTMTNARCTIAQRRRASAEPRVRVHHAAQPLLEGVRLTAPMKRRPGGPSSTWPMRSCRATRPRACPASHASAIQARLPATRVSPRRTVGRQRSIQRAQRRRGNRHAHQRTRPAEPTPTPALPATRPHRRLR